MKRNTAMPYLSAVGMGFTPL